MQLCARLKLLGLTIDRDALLGLLLGRNLTIRHGQHCSILAPSITARSPIETKTRTSRSWSRAFAKPANALIGGHPRSRFPPSRAEFSSTVRSQWAPGVPQVAIRRTALAASLARSLAEALVPAHRRAAGITTDASAPRRRRLARRGRASRAPRRPLRGRCSAGRSRGRAWPCRC